MTLPTDEEIDAEYRRLINKAIKYDKRRRAYRKKRQKKYNANTDNMGDGGHQVNHQYGSTVDNYTNCARTPSSRTKY